MVKKPTTPKRRTTVTREPPRPKLRMFKPMSWYEHDDNPMEYLAHINRELGRLGIQRHDLHETSRQVLQNIEDWLGERPNEAYANLVDWTNLDLQRVSERLDCRQASKPRIELHAKLTKKDNLTVRWYPRGWSEAFFDWRKESRSQINFIERYRFPEEPDFCWFTGDEPATFQERATNELMFIRGVKWLDPAPREPGPFATVNYDVLEGLLVSLVAASYKSLISQLCNSFEVTVVDNFEIETVDEADEMDNSPFRSVLHRPIGWGLVHKSPPPLKTSADIIPLSLVDKPD